MDYKLELEKLNANMIEDNGLVEVYFDEKTDFIKHIVELHKIDIDFNDEKKCFILNEQELARIQKFIEKVAIRPLIIFDMDGVIMNTNDSFPVATCQTYNHFTGEELTFDEINEIKYRGGFNSDWDILMYLFDERDFTVKFEDMAKYYMDIYFDGKGGLIDDETLILTEDCLEELIKNYNLAIFTGRDKASATYTVNKWNIKKYFYPMITCENVGWNHQKPDTKGVSIIKEKVIADEIYYLGDTVDDMICARNSKVNGIGILPPRDKSEKLKLRLFEEGAITVLENTNDLPQFLSERKNLITKM